MGKDTDVWPWRELIWLKMLGWWPYMWETRKAQKISEYLGTVYCFIVIFIFIPEVANVIILFSQRRTVDGILSLTTVMMGVECLFKITTFIVMRPRIKFITDKLDEMDRRGMSILEPEEIEKIKRPGYIIRQMTLIYITSSMVSSVQWILSPPVNLIYGRREFLFESMYPWPVDTPLKWAATYLWLVVHITTAISALCIIDSLSWVMLILTHIQICYLRAVLRRLDFTGPRGVDGHGPRSLRFCVSFHQDIILVCNEINTFLGPTILMHVLMVTLVLCLSIFLFATAEEQDLRTLNMIELACCQTFEMFMFNWLCQRIQDQAEKMLRDAYTSNWFEGSEKDQKALLFFTNVCNKEKTFGFVVNASFQTFISVLQSTFSYYNFLTAVSE